MENPFKELEKPVLPVPEQLKEKVMKDIAMAKLLMDLASLFSLSVGSIIEQTIKKRNKI